MPKQIVIGGLIAAALLASVSPCRADAIEDAEARRRGVPVAQVQAENALAREKAKIAALEKQVAELQKKIAELQSAGVTAATQTTAPPVTTGPATAIVEGPRLSSPLYDDFVNRYLTGDWEKLAGDMTAKEKEIAALPAGNASDLAYIKRTLAECRPIWWDQIKTGKIKQFRQVVWKSPVNVTFVPSSDFRLQGFANSTAGLTANIAWPLEHMDARDPIRMADVSMNAEQNCGLTRGDGLSWGIWSAFGNAQQVSLVGADKIRSLSPADKTQLDRYAGFWAHVTAGYYGTPGARRIVCIQSSACLESAMDGIMLWAGRRPLGTAILLDLKQNQASYTNLRVESVLGLEALGSDAHLAEGFLGKPVVQQFLSAKITLAEDRRLRDLIKTVADANTRWNVSKITLPGGQAYDLDPAKDPPLAAARLKIINGK